LRTLTEGVLIGIRFQRCLSAYRFLTGQSNYPNYSPWQGRKSSIAM
jgi:hypothetical protein